MITTSDDPQLDELCEQLSALGHTLEDGSWPRRQMELCGEYGVFEWFIPCEWGGQDWNESEIVRGYLKLSAACLNTTFIITQRTGACRRIAVSENDSLKQRWLQKLTTNEVFSTVGVSHLTTSRRHLAKPVLCAEETSAGFRLDGFSPWVTGSPQADMVVTGATMADGRQILVALPTDLKGVSTPPTPKLVGLSSSQTGQFVCDRVEMPSELLLAGPIENVMQSGSGAGTGGLQTSTLAVGLAGAAVDLIEKEAGKRPELDSPAAALRAEWQTLCGDLLSTADGQPVCSNEELRTRANSHVLRASQAALSAAKGTGYVEGHPAGRWCREALFFLVWSCPQSVVAANLCELAGIEG